MQETYWNALRALIRRRFGGKSVSLCTALPYCQGAFPSDVRVILEKLDREGVLTFAKSSDKRFQRVNNSSRVGSSLPPPHPANYDWRFTKRTQLRLKRILVQLGGPRSSIALFGAPSLLQLLESTRRRVVLFDRNHSIITSLRRTTPAGNTILHDLFVRIEGYAGDFDVVLADPPWYPEFYRAFIVRAGEILGIGGWLLISMLPPLTRPSARMDRKKIEEVARRVGFRLRKRFESEAMYESPPFEVKTLHELGVHCGNPWRVADLYLFQKVRNATKRISTNRSRWDVRWLTFHIDGVEIKLRDRGDTPRVQLKVRQITERGETLGSVSRRHKKRAYIDLWTSNNVAFSVSRIAPMKEALLEAQDGRPPKVVVTTVGAIFQLTPQERRELRKLMEVITRKRSD